MVGMLALGAKNRYVLIGALVLMGGRFSRRYTALIRTPAKSWHLPWAVGGEPLELAEERIALAVCGPFQAVPSTPSGGSGTITAYAASVLISEAGHARTVLCLKVMRPSMGLLPDGCPRWPI